MTHNLTVNYTCHIKDLMYILLALFFGMVCKNDNIPREF